MDRLVTAENDLTAKRRRPTTIYASDRTLAVFVSLRTIGKIEWTKVFEILVQILQLLREVKMHFSKG